MSHNFAFGHMGEDPCLCCLLTLWRFSKNTHFLFIFPWAYLGTLIHLCNTFEGSAYSCARRVLCTVGKSGRKKTIIVSEEPWEGQQEGVKRGYVGSLYAFNFHFVVIFDFEIKRKIVARTVKQTHGTG